MSKLQAHNLAVINAPIGKIWAVITDIDLLPKVNPGVISASGRMDKLGEFRTCTIDNNGRKGQMTEQLIELIPESKTVWTIESDTMGMKKMLKDTRFVFQLEKVSETSTSVISETYYDPANFIAKIMNALLMKRMIGKAQHQILSNIQSLVEK